MQINRLFEIVYLLLDKKQMTAKELAEQRTGFGADGFACPHAVLAVYRTVQSAQLGGHAAGKASIQLPEFIGVGVVVRLVGKDEHIRAHAHELLFAVADGALLYPVIVECCAVCPAQLLMGKQPVGILL